MPAHPGSGPAHVWAEVIGGDALGRGHQPALCWWLPEGSSVQHAYRLRTDDGFDTGRVDSPIQSYVRLPVFDRSRRSAAAQVKVWTDLGESDWSDPVRLEAGLLGDEDWSARWIGADEDPRPGKGSRPAYWLRSSFEVPAFSEARLYVTALGLYEAFLDGQRVGDAELTPGYTQYRVRVQYQAFDVTSLVRPGRHVLAVLLADGWYRGQVGLPRAADQYGDEVALRAQLEVRTPGGWQVAAASDPGWHVAPSHITAADLIGGQREDHRRLDPAVHDPAIDDTVFDDRPWRPAVTRDVAVAVVRSIAPPVRRVQQIRPVTVGRAATGAPSWWTSGRTSTGGCGWRGRAGGQPADAVHGEWLDAEGDLTTAHLDVDLPIVAEPLPLGQVDEVVSRGDGDVFEPRFTTHGFRYVRVEGYPAALKPDDVTAVVVHSDLRRLGWFGCSDDRVNRLHEAVVWSLRSNMCDIPTDCPQRERAAWTGDWQVFAPTAAYLYDVLAFTRKWLADLSLDQRADGCVPNMSEPPHGAGPGRHHWTAARLPRGRDALGPHDGGPHDRVVRLELAGALLDLFAHLAVTLSRDLDLGGVSPLLVHGDDRGRQVRPGHLRLRCEQATRAAGRALDVRAPQDDDVEVAHRAKPRRPEVARRLERHPELAGDVAPEYRRPVDRGGV